MLTEACARPAARFRSRCSPHPERRGEHCRDKTRSNPRSKDVSNTQCRAKHGGSGGGARGGGGGCSSAVDAMQHVDAMQDGGYFARFGEPAPQGRGVHAGAYRGVVHMQN